MGDFIVDLRPPSSRRGGRGLLAFADGLETGEIDEGPFTLHWSSADRSDLWAPFRGDDGVLVTVHGRVVFDEADWARAPETGGQGGLAARILHERYRRGGIDGIGALNGACAVWIHDPAAGRLWLRSDPFGAFPCFQTVAEGRPVLSSHPDALATLTGQEEAWDRSSLAEFLATGVVSEPYSYYEGVTSLPAGVLASIDLGAGEPKLRVERRDELQFETDHHDFDALSEELASAIGRASHRRTLPRLGNTAIALSGGLDSRTLLCTAADPSILQAFCCFDDENREVRTARRIAAAMDVPFLPFRRPFEHYGGQADAGVRISGGMGDLGNNHFLGCRDVLAEHGIETLVTGCYFDYLFKSLALDVDVDRFTRIETSAPYRAASYHQHFPLPDAWAGAVAARQEERFPAELRRDDGEWARRERAARRTFPIAREGDNQSRLVPLRVMGWSAPAIDLDLLEVYRKLPIAFRLNRRAFHAAVQRACTPEVARIMDVNTGLRVGAPQWAVSSWRYVIALRHRIEEVRSSIMTEGSWPNWHYYVGHSEGLRGIWERPNPQASETLAALMGERWSPTLGDHRSIGGELPLRLLTLKSWLDQRAGLA